MGDKKQNIANTIRALGLLKPATASGRMVKFQRELKSYRKFNTEKHATTIARNHLAALEEIRTSWHGDVDAAAAAKLV